jgi:predicted ester cyclase
MSSETRRAQAVGRAGPLVDAAAANEAIVRRIFDSVINDHDLAAADGICTDDCVLSVPGLSLPPGPDGLKQFARSLHDGFPDLHVVVDDVIASSDGVAVRWRTVRQTHTGEYRGLPPTGRSVTLTGTNFYRLESGLITGAWVQADSLGLAQQLGVVPPDDVGAGARVRFILGSLLRVGYLQARYSARSRRAQA